MNGVETFSFRVFRMPRGTKTWRTLHHTVEVITENMTVDSLSIASWITQPLQREFQTSKRSGLKYSLWNTQLSHIYTCSARMCLWIVSWQKEQGTVWMQICVVVKDSHKNSYVSLCFMFKRTGGSRSAVYPAKLIVSEELKIGKEMLHFQVFKSARRTFTKVAISHAISTL